MTDEQAKEIIRRLKKIANVCYEDMGTPAFEKGVNYGLWFAIEIIKEVTGYDE